MRNLEKTSYSTMKSWKRVLKDKTQDKNDHSQHLLNIVLEVLAMLARGGKKGIYIIHIGKELKLLLCPHDMILHIENFKDTVCVGAKLLQSYLTLWHYGL